MVIWYEGVHFEVVHEIALAHVAHPAQVAGVRTVALVRHHVVHQRRLLTEPTRTEITWPRPHRRVLILYIKYILTYLPL